MKLEEMQPFVRFSCRMKVSASRSGRLCAARDCRLFRLEEGTAEIWIQGLENVEMSIGRSVYIPAGCPYRLTFERESVFFIVNFDFDRKNASQSLPMPLSEGMEAVNAFSVPVPEDAPFFGTPFVVEDSAALSESFQLLKEESAHPLLYTSALLSAHLFRILCEMARSVRGGEDVQSDAVKSMLSFIRENYALPLTNRDIALFVNYHPNYANRLFERQTGETLRQALIRVRIRHAVTLLLSTSLSVTEIAQQVGFSSLSLFTKQFTRSTGVAPSRYRRNAIGLL